ncbi:MAG: TIGR03546 family protein [Spirochaetaceae bacterium]|nr:MAG: TIGR03546 family protein [Spirochaetaceae bacterium]
MFAVLTRIVAALNANRRPGEIAGACSFAVMLALLPAGNLIWVSLFALVFLVKVNLGIALLLTAILTPMAVLADGFLDRVGYAVLTAPALQTFFTRLYNAPFGPLTGFNNSLVPGALIVGLLLWVPVFFLCRALVQAYRERLRVKIIRSPLVQWFARFPLVRRVQDAARRARSIYEWAG